MRGQASYIAIVLCLAQQGCFSLPSLQKQTIAKKSAVDQARHLSNIVRETPGTVPSIASSPTLPPLPRAAERQATYSVVVNNTDINALLFALARDAKLNIDVHPDVTGKVTLNAIDQTLTQILNRVSKQVDMHYELENGVLNVTRDLPFLKQYKVDYVNMSRDANANVSVATQISSTGRGAGGSSSGSSGSAGSSSGGNNNSLTSISSRSNNRFWETLVSNLRDILRESTKPAAADGTAKAATPAATGAPVAAGAISAAGSTGSTASPAAAKSASAGEASADSHEAVTVIANPETGMVSIRATHRQHEKIQEFLAGIMQSARRQVLIEASVVEVQLSNEFQQGINWQLLSNSGRGFRLTQQPNGTMPLGSGVAANSGPGGLGFSSGTPGASPTTAGFTSGNPAPQSLFTLSYLNTSSALGNVAAAVSLLESFGRVKVLSSPKISALNNQTALLKVVDNKIYFTLDVTITPATASSAPIVSYNSTVNTVPIGFVMSVTPQINENGVVTLNMRPTISRIIGYVLDPSPALAQAGVSSRVPEIQTREMESIMQVASGQIAVMGGLIQDSEDNEEDTVPGMSDMPVIGNLFKYKSKLSKKSELVIFIRPMVIRSGGMDGDLAAYKQFLPKEEFFDAVRP
ncbi:MAG: pilus (MSHA type) biogenesis protein MshL [Burkholderiaceae bacterium]